jgi:hypothetical protein
MNTTVVDTCLPALEECSGELIKVIGRCRYDASKHNQIHRDWIGEVV